MKTKKLTVTEFDPKYSTKSVTIEVPDDIWFNVSVGRGRLAEAKKITMAQFLTTSNTSIWATLQMMKPGQLAKFKSMLWSDSKRARDARFLIEKLEGSR